MRDIPTKAAAALSAADQRSIPCTRRGSIRRVGRICGRSSCAGVDSSISIRIYPIPPAGVQSFGLAYSGGCDLRARNGRMQTSPTSFSTAATFPTHASQGALFTAGTLDRLQTAGQRFKRCKAAACALPNARCAWSISPPARSTRLSFRIVSLLKPVCKVWPRSRT